jgi:tight adherence protein B
MIVPIATFLILVSGIYAAYWVFVLRPEEQAVGAVKRRLRGKQVGSAVRAKLEKELQSLSAIGPLDAALRRAKSRTEGLQLLIDQSGLRITVGTLLLASATLALLAFVIVQRLTAGVDAIRSTWILIAATAALFVAFIPTNVVRFVRTRRMYKFEEQFPEALDLLSRALRAGHAFTTGVDMVATEMPKPIGPEFRLLYDQQNYGMPMDDALRAFAQRIPVLDARFFVTAVLIQRESGGNLAEVLDNLSGVIRERFRVKRQMRVISAHGRITGWILVCLPPVLGLALMVVNEEHRRTMFGNPLGIQMIVGAIILQVIGTLIIRKIVNVEY